MQPPQDQDLTELIAGMQRGDKSSRESLVSILYSALHARATRELLRQQGGSLLQPTALVNEVWIRLQSSQAAWTGRGHFLAVAAQAMRNLVIDHARRRRSVSLQDDESSLPLDELVRIYEAEDVDVIELHECLSILREIDESAAQIIEMRFFVGATNDEAARAVGVSPRTASRQYDFAKRWLKKRMQA